MNRWLVGALGLSVVGANVIDILFLHTFKSLYYVLWLGVVGTYVWKKREVVEARLAAWQISPPKKFILLGLLMILLEEIFAGFSMHLWGATSLTDIGIGIVQYWAFNLLALPGIIIGWYFLLSKIFYTRKEVLVLVGLFGLFAEKMYLFVFIAPLIVLFLILPTMATYALIITPSLFSFKGGQGRATPWYIRYVLGFVVPLLFSVPFILLLGYLRLHYPGAFPPVGFVS